MHFDILRTKFSAGTKKKRLPNHTIIIGDGKYKGLTLFSWIFSNIKLVKYIFSTKTVCLTNQIDLAHFHSIFCLPLQMQLKTVRSFTKTPLNTFKELDSEEATKIIGESPTIAGNQLRKIRPTIYRTFLKVRNNENVYKVHDDCKFVMFKFEIIQVVELNNFVSKLWIPSENKISIFFF